MILLEGHEAARSNRGTCEHYAGKPVRSEVQMKTRPLLPLLIFVLSAGAALCDTYRWENHGVINFTDNIENVPKKYRKKALAEARKEGTDATAPAGNSAGTDSIQPDGLSQPPKEISRSLEKPPESSKHHDPHQHHRRHDRRKPHYGDQSPGVVEAQRSAYESQSYARKAMDQAEKRMRQNRRVLDAGQLPARGEQQKREEQTNKSRNRMSGP